MPWNTFRTTPNNFRINPELFRFLLNFSPVNPMTSESVLKHRTPLSVSPYGCEHSRHDRDTSPINDH